MSILPENQWGAHHEKQCVPILSAERAEGV